MGLGDTLLTMSQVNYEIPRLYLGDHLKVSRFGYSHHGIYVGNKKVIANTQEGVDLFTLDEFSLGSRIYVVSEQKYFSRAQIVARAYSRLGEHNYNILTNNCEHFALWCTQDLSKSKQVRRAICIASSMAVPLATASVAFAIKHKKIFNNGLNATATLASLHPAGLALKTISYSIKIAGITHNIKSSIDVLNKDLNGFEKVATITGIVGGLPDEVAEKAAVKISQLTKKGLDRSHELKAKINTKISSVLSKLGCQEHL